MATPGVARITLGRTEVLSDVVRIDMSLTVNNNIET